MLATPVLSFTLASCYTESIDTPFASTRQAMFVSYSLVFVQEEAKQAAERNLEGCQQMSQRYQHLLKDRQEADASLLQGNLANYLLGLVSANHKASYHTVLLAKQKGS